VISALTRQRCKAGFVGHWHPYAFPGDVGLMTRPTKRQRSPQQAEAKVNKVVDTVLKDFPPGG